MEHGKLSRLLQEKMFLMTLEGGRRRENKSYESYLALGWQALCPEDSRLGTLRCAVLQRVNSPTP